MLLVSLLFVAVINPYSSLNSIFCFKNILVCLLSYYSLYKYSYMIICMAMVEAQIYYPRYICVVERS